MKKPAAQPAPAVAAPEDRQPVTHIVAPFNLPTEGGAYVLEPGAIDVTPDPVEAAAKAAAKAAAEAGVQTPVKEA
jgi:hypothetical protein